MPATRVHVVFWLPAEFYSAVAAALVEMLEVVSVIRRAKVFSFEFVSHETAPTSTSGITFATKTRPSKPPDVLVLLGPTGLHIPELLSSLERESECAAPYIAMAQRRGALLAAHCGASYFLAHCGLIDGKRATISWWLKAHALRRFPKVKWDPARLLIRQGRIYTCGGGFSGLELGSALLRDLGFAREERVVRKLMVLPASRALQTPYEFPLEGAAPEPAPFADRVEAAVKGSLNALDLNALARRLKLTPRTLSRRFSRELRTSPGQWIQARRLEAARHLLETTQLSVSEVCYRVGYRDVASFSRLFSRVTGLPPGEYRRQSR